MITMHSGVLINGEHFFFPALRPTQVQRVLFVSTEVVGCRITHSRRNMEPKKPIRFLFCLLRVEPKIGQWERGPEWCHSEVPQRAEEAGEWTGSGSQVEMLPVRGTLLSSHFAQGPKTPFPAK